jgi:hypothetical protein
MYDGLKSAFLKAPVLDTPVTVYRGISGKTGSDKFMAQIGEAIMQGKPNITLHGFVSTSTKKDGAFSGPVAIEIAACHGLDARVYGVASEYEMLLDDNQEYRIDKYEVINGKPHVKLTQLPPKTWKGKK